VEQRKTRSTGMQKEFPLIPMRSLAKSSVARSSCKKESLSMLSEI